MNRLVEIYRWAIVAYPPAFRVMFADSMTADFRDALHDAHKTGQRKATLVLLAQVAWDLICSLGVQWARTSVPWMTMAYSMALVAFCEGLAATLLGSPFKWAVVLILLPPVSATMFTFWFLVPQLRRRRSVPPCLKSVA